MKDMNSEKELKNGLAGIEKNIQAIKKFL